MGWAGRVTAFLDVATFYLQRPGGVAKSAQEPPVDALCGFRADGSGYLLFPSRLFRGQSLSGAFPSIERRLTRLFRARWQWTEPAAAIPLHGDSSPHALSGLCGNGGAICLLHGGADHPAVGR